MKTNCLNFKHKIPSLVIIADDLTGALDTAIKFSQRGARTIAISTTSSKDVERCLNQDDDIEVLSINTATRHVDKSKAYEIVFDIVSYLVSIHVKYIYKKTDSVLRGNIASELEALKDACDVQFIPFIPAYPEMGRTVENGKMYVAGRLLSETEFANDPFQKIVSSNACDIFTSSSLNVRTSVSASYIPSSSDEGIIIYDGKTEIDSKKTAENLIASRIHVFCGCAGFAESLASTLYDGTSEFADITLKPLLILCGSVNKVSKSQLDCLSRLGYPRNSISEDDLLSSTFFDDDAGLQFLNRVEKELEEDGVSIVDTTGSSDSIKERDFSEAHDVSEGLGRIAVGIQERFTSNIFVIGGDTLLSFLSLLGKIKIEPVCEIMEGLVFSYVYQSGKKITVLSKSGGFGSETMLADLLEENKTRQEEII